MVDVVRFKNNNYKKCCGNCKFYKACDYKCTNPEKLNIMEKKKRRYIKAYIPSDIGCKYFSFIPNKIYDNKDCETRVVDTVIFYNDKYIMFSLATCNHLSKKGESMLIQENDKCLICKRCKTRFIAKEE